MPAAPEIFDRGGNIGIVEVLVNVKTEHFAQTDRHIRITGKIEIDLESISHNADPGHRRGNIVDAQCKNFICGFGHDIGNNDFFSQPLQETDSPLVKQRQRNLAVVNLRRNIVIF